MSLLRYLVYNISLGLPSNMLFVVDSKRVTQKLSRASGSTKEEAEKWLMKQPLCQIYLPAPKYIPRPNASISLFA